MKGAQKTKDPTTEAYEILYDLVVPKNVTKPDYKDFFDGIQEIADSVTVERLLSLLNYQDPTGKTLIHHIIENPGEDYRPGLWAVIELHLKGAKFLQDKLGNTALHSCVNRHQDLLQKQVKLGLADAPMAQSTGFNGTTRELIMMACMSNVGALLLCGADPSVKNLKGEEVFGMMSSIATIATPNASCTRSFLEFFKAAKVHCAYPWAPNVVNWVDSLKIDDSVRNASLVATTNTATRGCTLF